MSATIKKGYVIKVMQRLNAHKETRISQANVYLFEREGVWKAEVHPRLSPKFLIEIEQCLTGTVSVALADTPLYSGRGEHSMVGKREFEIQIHGRNPIAGKAEIFAKVYLVTTDTVRLEVEDDLRLDYADLKNILHNVLPDILTKAVYQYS